MQKEKITWLEIWDDVLGLKDVDPSEIRRKIIQRNLCL